MNNEKFNSSKNNCIIPNISAINFENLSQLFDILDEKIFITKLTKKNLLYVFVYI